MAIWESAGIRKLCLYKGNFRALLPIPPFTFSNPFPSAKHPAHKVKKLSLSLGKKPYNTAVKHNSCKLPYRRTYVLGNTVMIISYTQLYVNEILDKI